MLPVLVILVLVLLGLAQFAADVVDGLDVSDDAVVVDQIRAWGRREARDTRTSVGIPIPADWRDRPLCSYVPFRGSRSVHQGGEFSKDNSDGTAPSGFGKNGFPMVFSTSRIVQQGEEPVRRITCVGGADRRSPGDRVAQVDHRRIHHMGPIGDDHALDESPCARALLIFVEVTATDHDVHVPRTA